MHVLQATVCAKFGIECIVYMGAKDMERQKLNVFRMRLLGADVRPVHAGTSTLKDATSEAIRDWVTNVETTHYILGSAAGPHPYPMMVSIDIWTCILGCGSVVGKIPWLCRGVWLDPPLPHDGKHCSLGLTFRVQIQKPVWINSAARPPLQCDSEHCTHTCLKSFTKHAEANACPLHFFC